MSVRWNTCVISCIQLRKKSSDCGLWAVSTRVGEPHWNNSTGKKKSLGGATRIRSVSLGLGKKVLLAKKKEAKTEERIVHPLSLCVGGKGHTVRVWECGGRSKKSLADEKRIALCSLLCRSPAPETVGLGCWLLIVGCWLLGLLVFHCVLSGLPHGTLHTTLYSSR